MAVNPPTRGQRDWDDEMNNILQSLDSGVQAAASKADVAASDAAYARNRADEVHTAVVGGTDAAVSGFISDDTSATKVALNNTFARGSHERLADETGMLGWSVALADRGSAPADIVVVGDSLIEGQGGTSIQTRAVEKALAALRSRFPTTGLAGSPTTVGGIPGGGAGYLPAYSAAFGTGTYVPTKTGTTSTQTRGLGHRSVRLDSAGASWTQPARGYTTSIGLLIYRTGTTDAYTISIDGSVVATVAAGAAAGYVWWTSGALARGAHTLLVTQTAGTPQVCGSMHYDGDEAKGIRLWDSSKSGAKVNTFSKDAAAQGSEEWANALVTVGVTPDLIVMECMLNDANSGDVNAYGPATYADNLQRFVNLCRSKWANVPVALVSPYRRPTVAAYSGTWDDYINAARDVAAANVGVSWLNVDRITPNLDPDTYGFMADATHPNDKGYGWLSRVLTEFLAGGVADSGVLATPEAMEANGVTHNASGADGITAHTINAATGAATTRQRWTRNKVLRWAWDLFGTETGSGNAGGDLSLRAYNDAGGLGALVLTVQRSNGIPRFYTALRLFTAATGSRPTASSVGAGATMFDTTLGKPIWSDGTNWKDATGTNV